MKEIWLYQIGDSEIWDMEEECDSKEEAIRLGMEDITEDYNKLWKDQEYQCHESFEVGQVKYYKPDRHVFWVDEIEERINEQVYSIGDGEYTFDAFKKATVAQRQELQQKLADTLNEWLEENKLEASFGEIVNQETIETGFIDKEEKL